MFRPPSEAYSLILQTDIGCPHNQCTFCGMYKGVKHSRLPVSAVLDLITSYAGRSGDARRIFLADGDVMIRPYDELHEILHALNVAFPRLARVNVYANGSSISRKTDSELNSLRSLKLNTLYMGLESGDETVLEQCRKGETVEGMVKAGVSAQAAGLRMSVMVLLGLGGAANTEAHARNTATAVNKMQPRFLSTLRIVPVPGTALCDAVENHAFKQLTEYGVAAELRDMISQFELQGTIFRSNHSSNVVSPEGRFPKDKERILSELDALLKSDVLDKTSPGRMPLSL